MNIVISFWSASIEIVMQAVILTLETNHKNFCDFETQGKAKAMENWMCSL